MSQRNRWMMMVVVAVAMVCGLLLHAGCKKKEAGSSAQSSSARAPGEPIAQIHWLGKEMITKETNSGYFMGIWAMPQSQKLQSYFLDQLSLAPFHALFANAAASETNQLVATNHPSAVLLRPLLDDLMEKETFLEISLASNGSIDAGMAIHLDPQRVNVWMTNLPQVLNALKSAPGMEDYHLAVSHEGEWTFVGVGRKDNPALRDIQSRYPFPKSSMGGPALWLEGALKLAKLFPDVHWPLDLPEVHFGMMGYTQGVTSTAVLDFPKPLPFQLEPWTIPTNLVHGPIHTFTAIQGVAPLISKLGFWNDLNVGGPPNQLLFWAHVAHPALTYVAAPMTNARAALSVITERLLTNGNAWLATNGSGQFELAKDYEGVFCTAGNPLLGPFLQIHTNTEPNFLLAGWGTSNSTNVPPPPWLFADLAGRTNLVFYDREMTGGRISAWFYLAQAVRVLLRKAQVPFDSPSVEWLLKPGEMLGLTVTHVTKTGPSQLMLQRTSSVGLNSIEMHFLSDWLESPSFPRGVHTTVARGSGHRVVRPQTDAAPPSVTNTNH